MICLGIESTAHTFGIGIVSGNAQQGTCTVLANVMDSFQTPQGGGGMRPHEVAEHHVAVCDTVLKGALEKAGLCMRDIELIAFSKSPGLGQALRIGCLTARMLASLHSKPLVGVNHCIAHQEIGIVLTKCIDPVMLYASGANTQVIAYEAGKYRIFGETLDIGVGNFLDVFARTAGLGFPGGPKIEQLALQGKNLILLPYVVKGMDVSFGGLLTNLTHKLESKKYAVSDLAYSLQETAYAMLIEVAERAMAHTGKEELLLAGGVACNKRLQEMAAIMCRERGARCFIPEKQFLIDNGAMIAWTGLLMRQNGGLTTDISEAVPKPYVRTDEVVVTWKEEKNLKK